MPMIDVTAATGTFSDKSKLAKDLAACIMRWEAVPDIPFHAFTNAEIAQTARKILAGG